jgi:hypothetical protein
MARGVHHKGIENNLFLAIDFAPLIASLAAAVAVGDGDFRSFRHASYSIAPLLLINPSATHQQNRNPKKIWTV